jgi:hypothetical protein
MMERLSAIEPHSALPHRKCCSVVNDLFLPVLMFGALGGMSWAVRGCSGYGAVAGCLFAGVLWGTAWWYLSNEPAGAPQRWYSSGWVILALTLGIGLSGARGWMQWPSFFSGQLQTNAGKGEWVPISPFYGYLWMFIAGVPWAGLGACALAWCGSERPTRVWHWALRIACGVGGAMLIRGLYTAFPAWFFPLYQDMESRYLDLATNPNLKRLMNDCGAALLHLGFYLGFLSYEVIRRNWRNVTLILTTGLLNGIGWAALQTWKFSEVFWKDSQFNFWRCWESSGGISIGIALGVSWFLVNRKSVVSRTAEIRGVTDPLEWFLIFCGVTAFGATFMQLQMAGWASLLVPILYLFAACFCLQRTSAGVGGLAERFAVIVLVLLFSLVRVFPFLLPGEAQNVFIIGCAADVLISGAGVFWYFRRFRAGRCRLESSSDDDLTRREAALQEFAVGFGILTGLGLSVRNGAKGWFNIYVGNEDYWSGVLWKIAGPLMAVILLAICLRCLYRGRKSSKPQRLSSRFASFAIWTVLFVQNVLAQLVTGPPSLWNEFIFSIYYVLLFLITAVIAIHYGTNQQRSINDQDVLLAPTE